MNSRPFLRGIIIWSVTNRFSIVALKLLSGLVFARALGPLVLGQYALINSVVLMSLVFTQSGLGKAIIQKNLINQNDIDAAYTTNMTLAGFSYILVILLSDLFLKSFNLGDLKLCLTINSVILIVDSARLVPESLIKRDLHLRSLALTYILAVLVAMICGFAGLFLGLEIYSLVVFNLVNSLSLTIIFIWKSKKRPRFRASRAFQGETNRVGLNILFAGITRKLNEFGSILVLGKMFGPMTVGLINEGKKFPKLVFENLEQIINNVTFPILSKQQDDLFRHWQIFRTTQTITLLILMLLGGLMFASCDFLVECLLGPEWTECIVYLQFFIIYFLIQTLGKGVINYFYSLRESQTVRKISSVVLVANLFNFACLILLERLWLFLFIQIIFLLGELLFFSLKARQLFGKNMGFLVKENFSFIVINIALVYFGHIGHFTTSYERVIVFSGVLLGINCLIIFSNQRYRTSIHKILKDAH